MIQKDNNNLYTCPFCKKKIERYKANKFISIGGPLILCDDCSNFLTRERDCLDYEK